MSNLFNRFAWGGSGGGGGGGAGRGGHPPRRPLGLGAPRPSISFEDDQDYYDTADDGRDYYPPAGRPASRRGLSPSEYEARRNAIFSTGAASEYMDSGTGGGGKYATAPPRWSGYAVSGSGDSGATGPDNPSRRWTQPGPAATGLALATRGCTNCCAASRWSRQARGGGGSTPHRHRSHWHPSSGFLGHCKCSCTPCPSHDGRRHSPKPTLATRGGRG
jgi:hypothetical protein